MRGSISWCVCIYPLSGVACSPAGGIRSDLGATVALVALEEAAVEWKDVGARERGRVVTVRLLTTSERIDGVTGLSLCACNRKKEWSSAARRASSA
jgi:hypothetical protein